MIDIDYKYCLGRCQSLPVLSTVVRTHATEAPNTEKVSIPIHCRVQISEHQVPCSQTCSFMALYVILTELCFISDLLLFSSHSTWSVCLDVAIMVSCYNFGIYFPQILFAVVFEFCGDYV